MTEEDSTDVVQSQGIIRTQSIELDGLNMFISIYQSEFLYSCRNKENCSSSDSRKSIQTFNYHPHCILPATGHKFQVKMDQNGNFSLYRIIPKINNTGPLYTLPVDYRKTPEVVCNFDQANELMELIHYVQQYLIQTHERVKSTKRDFILIPFSLHNMYIQIEEIFSSGWTDSAFELLKKAKSEVEDFVKNRTDELTMMAQQLTKFIDTANGDDSSNPKNILEFNNVLKSPEYNAEKWQDEDMTSIYPQFLGDSSPNIFNKDSVRKILENLVLDILIPELDSWTIKKEFRYG